MSRTTYGVRPHDVDDVMRAGIAAWLERQLHPETIDDRAADAQVASMRQTADITLRWFPPAAAGAPGAASAGFILGAFLPAQATDTMRRSVDAPLDGAMPIGIPALDHDSLAAIKLVRAVYTERQLEEVMTDFWFNHFNVFGAAIRIVMEDYERSAIRAHVFGRFEDMLVATAQHPAMLMYLDNHLNRAPAHTTTAGRGTGAVAGELNENYARELLELHTLGVDGGYTQHDVIDTARALSGWSTQVVPAVQTTPTVASAAGALYAPGALVFVFTPEFHDGGEKVVLGRTLPAGRGIEDGLDVLRLLAQHPSTAAHVAHKLAQHFVADDPPADLVDHLATVFRFTGGDLRAVTRALFTAEAFYDPAYVQGKVKRPFELVASALRVTGARVRQPRVAGRALVQYLRSLGHLPYDAAEPTGYRATQDAWVSATSMFQRQIFAVTLAEGRLPGLQLQPFPPPDAVDDMRWSAGAINAGTSADGDPHDERRAIVRRVLAGVLAGGADAALEETIVEDIQEVPRVAMARAADRPAAMASVALGVALASPAFQRH